MEPTESKPVSGSTDKEGATPSPPTVSPEVSNQATPAVQAEPPAARKESYAAAIPDEVLSFECISGSVPFEDIYNSKARRNDPFHDLVHFPEDNLVLETFSKFHRSQYAATPQAEYSEILDPYVKVCFECFSAEWTLLRSTHSGFDRWYPDKSVFELEAPLYAGDDLDLFFSNEPSTGGRERSQSFLPPARSKDAIYVEPLSQKDPHFEYIKPYNKRTDVNNKKKRTEGQLQTFQYYDPNYDWQPGTEVALCKRIRKTLRPDTKDEQNKFKPFYFVVEPVTLAFQLGLLEPFFCTLTLYQVDQKTHQVSQISEKYNFQRNSELMLNQLVEHWNPPHADNHTDKALFSVTRRTGHVYLVLEITKVLQGDPEMSVDPYNKIATIFKQKDQEKIKGKIQYEAEDYCQRLGKYRQPFGWAVLQVFDAKGNLLLQPDTRFQEIFAKNARDSIANLVLQYDSPELKDSLKKAKDLHGVCCIKVSKFEPEEFETVRLVDSSLQVTKHSENVPEDAPLLKEVHEFLQFQTFVPNFFYVNNMYVYPLHANIGNRSGRNIVVRVQVKDNDSDLSAPGLKCIAHPYENTLVDEIYTSVYYHNKTPNFAEEFKLVLPPKLTQKHHLLFSFFHVVVAKKKKAEESESPICYAVVPLYSDGHIVVHNNAADNSYGAHFINKLEPDYVSRVIAEAAPAPGKAPFTMRFHLVSTIFPEDKSITEFLNIYHTSEDEVPDKKLVSVLKNLQDLSELLAIQYLPVIINNLLEVMVMRSNNKPQFEAFRTLVMVIHKVKSKLQENDIPRTALLELYTNYIFQQTFTNKHATYECLCSNFLLYMMELKCQLPSEQYEDSMFVNSWFIFDLVIKSMALQLESSGQLNEPQRKGLFDDVFVRTLSRLLVNLAKYFKDQMAQRKEIQLLNRNLALFMTDLFSVFDRGIVLDMVRTYLQDMTDPTQEELSTTYRVEFLQIVADNEHYIPLNLTFCSMEDLSVQNLTKLHPLAYTVIFNVLQSLKSSNSKVWDMAISALYDIVVKNAFDGRFTTKEQRQRVAAIYFVIVPMFIDGWSSFGQWMDEASLPTKREFYIVILYVLRTCKRALIRRWWQSELLGSQVQFLKLLDDMAKTFEYDPELKRATKTTLTPQVALFLNKAGAGEVADILKGISKKNDDPASEDKRLRLLTLHVELLILDILEDFVTDMRRELQRKLSTHSTMTWVVQVFCTLMRIRQSRPFVHNLYASLRAFAYKFTDVLFKGDNTYLSMLLQEILLHCNFPEPDINMEASTLLFILLKLNQRTTGSFGRTKIQAITTLSNLVQERVIQKDVVLNNSFARLAEYALHAYSTLHYRDLEREEAMVHNDTYAHTVYSSFARGVQDMCFTFSSILRDTLRVIEVLETDDHHVITDLYFQIAEGYKHTPDLRLVWLAKLARLQQDKDNLAEAGVTFTHSGALIADYLLSSEKVDTKVIDRDVFQLISPSIKEYANAGEEGVCQSLDFSIKGLIRNLRFAIRCFRTAEYYEYAAHLFKVLAPLYESTQAYHDLSQAYTQLQEFWSKVSMGSETRLFGQYFRVGFFGTPFGEDVNGKEYVYKEPGLTHILELTERLKALYEKRTGQEVGHIDAGKDLSTVDPSRCFLQITKIDPYMEGKPRDNFFQSHVNLSDFLYETPFTLTGKSHADDISQQYKRKTILTVAGSFPAMLTRLPVIRKRDVIVTPIENAIEDVNKRNVFIAAEVNRKPVNPKSLTQVLQGSALPQVNEGALSFCRIFLANYKEHPQEHVAQLCDSLNDFLEYIREGLSHNKQLIVTDHDKRFHFEMEGGFKQLEGEILEHIRACSFVLEPDRSSESVLTEFDEETDDMSDPITPRLHRKKSHSSQIPRRKPPASSAGGESSLRQTDARLSMDLSPNKIPGVKRSRVISVHKKPPPPAVPPPSSPLPPSELPPLPAPSIPGPLNVPPPPSALPGPLTLAPPPSALVRSAGSSPEQSQERSDHEQE